MSQTPPPETITLQAPPGTTILERPVQLRRRGYIQEFALSYGVPLICCELCLCSYCYYVSKGAVCLRSVGAMVGSCVCVGCSLKFTIICDTIARHKDFLAKVKVLQGKSVDQTTNRVLRIVLRFLE